MKTRSSVAAIAVLSLACVAGPALAADEVRVVDEGGIRDQWMLADGAKLVAPGYPGQFANGQPRDVCLALGYEIAPDGSTSKFRVLKQWNSETADKEPVDDFWSAFATVGADAVSQWKFKPRPEVTQPKPVMTVATLTWQTNKATDAAALRGKCRIEGLAAFLRNKNRGDMTDAQVDADNRARTREIQRRAGTPRTQ